MKKLLKFGFFALAISLSVVACNSNKKTDAAADSAKMDSVTVDTAAVDTAAVDTAKVDTAAVKK